MVLVRLLSPLLLLLLRASEVHLSVPGGSHKSGSPGKRSARDLLTPRQIDGDEQLTSGAGSAHSTNSKRVGIDRSLQECVYKWSSIDPRFSQQLRIQLLQNVLYYRFMVFKMFKSSYPSFIFLLYEHWT